MNPAKINCIEDLRQIYESRVPRMFYDYCDTGSYTTGTYVDNIKAFDKYKLRQRVARNIDNRSLKTKMVGQDVSMPVALAPIGLGGMQHADGEIIACRAAQKFGLPYTLTTMSICSIEEVAKHNDKPFWFQLYVMRDRVFSSDLVARARPPNVRPLCSPLISRFSASATRTSRTALSAPPKLTIPNILNMMTKPRWCAGMLGTKNRTFGNIVGHVKGVDRHGHIGGMDPPPV